MDHVIAVNPYINAEGQIDQADEDQIVADAVEQQRKMQERIDAQAAADQAQVDEQNAKLRADDEAEQERIAEANAQSRQQKSYSEALAESNLEHVRQPNEGDENYVEVPSDINVTDNDVHNDGSLDGEFGRFQSVEIPSLDEVIAREEEERQASIDARYEIIEQPGPVMVPEGLALPAPDTKE